MFIALLLITKKWTASLLVPYVFLILATTVFVRVSRELPHYELIPFWSYRDYFNGTDKTLLQQIIANVILFIPVGMLLWKDKSSKAVLIGAGISITVELLQLFSHRGLFEFDDVIHNTLGVVIGCLIAKWSIKAFRFDKGWKL